METREGTDEQREERIEVPLAWREVLERPWRGWLMIIGAPDTGKSTLARLLYAGLNGAGVSTALLDGDPGQASLGPPATMTLMLPESAELPPKQRFWRRFVGSTSPRGHMLPLLVGVARLREVAARAGVEAVVYDTSGLVGAGQGGARLKWAKMDLLQPAAVLALQREGELEPILTPLRRVYAERLWELPVPAAVRPRGKAIRRTHRIAQLGHYFRRAEEVELDWADYALFPRAAFRRHVLLGIEDAAGFLLGLGVLLRYDRERHRLTLLTPLRDWDRVAALTVGDVWVDPWTFKHGRIAFPPR
ncbi:MAG: hypothetical protein Kow00109_17360 [Acidobacteriota bacterium]